MPKPTGPLHIEKIISEASSKLSITGTVVVRDAAGIQWSFPATCFAHDLKPYAEPQVLDFMQWTSAVTDAVLPRYKGSPEAGRFDFEAAYRAGVPAEVAAITLTELVQSEWEKNWKEGAST